MRPFTEFPEAIVTDPYPFYARLRREAPVWRVPGTDAYFVSTWELVSEAASRVDDFSNHFRHTFFRDDDAGLGVRYDDPGAAAIDVFAGADPPDHTLHRKLFFPELMQKKMATLEADVAALAHVLVERLLASPEADAVEHLANPLPMQIVAERVIGFPARDVSQIQRWVFAGSRFMGGRLRLDEMAAVGAEAAGLMPWVDAQLDDAISSPPTADALGAAASGVRDGVLTRPQAAFALMVLLGAGGETTTSLIGNAVRVLAERPELQERLRAHADEVAAFVEEVLRFESPFRFHPRTTLRPVELGGVEIPEHAMVALCWGAANRDESVFDRADAFEIDRPNLHLHLGFGRGIHHCVGAPLARLEARVALTTLLERTRSFALDPQRPPQWTDASMNAPCQIVAGPS